MLGPRTFGASIRLSSTLSMVAIHLALLMRTCLPDRECGERRARARVSYPCLTLQMLAIFHIHQPLR
jgi:hypothetical protein